MGDLLVELYGDGICILNKCTKRRIRINFEDSSKGFFEINCKPNDFRLSIVIDCLIGFIDFGPGYLIICTESTLPDLFQDLKLREKIKNFENHLGNVDIWRVTDVLVLPMIFKYAHKKILKFNKKNKKFNKQFYKEGNNDGSDEKINDIENICSQNGIRVDFMTLNAGIVTSKLKSSPQSEINPININGFIEKSIENEFELSNLLTTARIENIQILRETKSILEREKFSENLPKKIELKRRVTKKFEKTVKQLFLNKCFYYSNTIDLSKEIFINSNDFKFGPIYQNNEKEEINEFFWNYFLSKPFTRLGGNDFTKPIICGYIDVINFEVEERNNRGKKFTGIVILISKKSIKRNGFRYMRRGIDDEGNVANFVDTEQILIIHNGFEFKICKFKIIRGSIPIFFKQDPFKLKPIPIIERDFDENNDKFIKHFNNLKNNYNTSEIVSILLIDENIENEGKLGKLFETLAISNNVLFYWFDFNKKISKLGYGNVDKLIYNEIGINDKKTIKEILEIFKYDHEDQFKQSGLLRVSCIDCLDRTNIVCKYINRELIRIQLRDLNFEISDSKEFTQLYSNLWANNGDNLSTMYANTNALKGDFTRTEKRKYTGILNDGLLSVSRYYHGMFTDYYKQVIVDILLGNINDEMFEQYENTLHNMDPNFNNEREITKNNLQFQFKLNFEQDENFIGSWWVKSIFKINRFKKGRLKEVIMLISNRHFYLIEIELGNIKQYFKINNKQILMIEIGNYFINLKNKISKDIEKNKGVRLFFKDYEKFEKDKNKNEITEKSEELQSLSIKFNNDMNKAMIDYIIGILKKNCSKCEIFENDIVDYKQGKRDTNLINIVGYELRKSIWG